ncbi:MAG: DUF1194 domain-containing protein [Proteobacteria bacterium]|nr:DUF1194 domain-containing protein [Pseudomonadota bacterium]
MGRKVWGRGFAWLLAALLWAAPWAGPALGQEGPVDLELVLAVDASGSIDEDEARLQRAGWADAITNPRVLGAIRSGGHGAIAVMFLEWAAIGCESVAVKWTRISDAVSAQKFAQGITKASRLDCWGGNAIGDAVAFATASILTNRFQAKRLVIDVSGDGPNTLGQPILLARQRALAAGISINGLVIMDPDRFFNAPGGGSLDDYYRSHIAGGAGSFVMVAKSRRAFRQAVLAKLVREIAEGGGPPGRPDNAVAAARAAELRPE